jgi:hypothetical protein
MKTQIDMAADFQISIVCPLDTFQPYHQWIDVELRIDSNQRGNWYKTN